MKKVMNVILLVFLIVIWGNIIIKFSFFNRTNIQSDFDMQKNTDFKMVNTQKDTFKLDFNLKDPFKKEDDFIVKKKLMLKKKSNKKLKPKIEKLIWPQIKYLGFHKKVRSRAKLALLRINSTVFSVRERKKRKVFI